MSTGVLIFFPRKNVRKWVKTPLFSISNLFSFTLYLSGYKYVVIFILHLLDIFLDKCDDIFVSTSASFVSWQMLYQICLTFVFWPKQFSQIHDFIQCYFIWKQEIIKVREWIPRIGPLTKVIRLKLFLGIVPSSSEDITRAMRGQLKRLSRITWEKWR